jgi:serine/threonine protein kinase
MVIINDKYEIVEKIGQGSFGQVFIGIHILTNKKTIIKIEPISSNGLLKHETNILYYLSRYRCPNIPSVFWYGNSDLSGSIPSIVPSILYKCLVMSYFPGYSLDHIRGKMTWEDKRLWFHSAIKILEKIHDTGVIHRDIKPVHFILSNDGEWKLIDFGLATFYSKERKNTENNQKKKGETGETTGTPNYVSIHIHHGFEPSRRDDLISLGYILLELCLYEILEELPWRKDSKDQYIKKEWEFLYTYISNLSNLLLQEKKNILFYFQECESWTFEMTPSYHKIKSIFL